MVELTALSSRSGRATATF